MQALHGENNANVSHTKDNKDINQLLSSGLQLPSAIADDVLTAGTISQNEPVVNTPKSDLPEGMGAARAGFGAAFNRLRIQQTSTSLRA